MIKKVKIFRAKLKDFMKGVGQEVEETKEAGSIIKRYVAGEKLTKEERAAVKSQFYDLMKTAGIGIPFVLIPGASVVLAICVSTARKHNINLLPSAFKKEDQLKQITKPSDLIGKTIENILCAEEERGMLMNLHQRIWIKFTDGSFAVIDTRDYGTGFSTDERIVISDMSATKMDSELVELGIISKEEHEKAKEEERIADEERYKRQDQQRQAEIERVELEQLNKLKQKYEGKAQTQE